MLKNKIIPMYFSTVNVRSLVLYYYIVKLFGTIYLYNFIVILETKINVENVLKQLIREIVTKL